MWSSFVDRRDPRPPAVLPMVVILLAICLVPAGAHVAEMPTKLALPPDQYMVVQQIYRNWAFFGIPINASILALIVQCWRFRAGGAAFLWSALALLAMVGTQIVFWTRVYPINVETQNWTVSPAAFDVARHQWETGHLISAALTFLALIFAVLALAQRPASARAPLSRD